eukprot:CAMPEP_0185731366 /NCGR_PEP_ID=MMETSP1171-20130828/12727_1 /TAXON_ID=374046 /ORGANISM="Helicotheca tamensis, Strain CCMP826" /LENGTH=539 /DNA_ID=CAMNT_0028400623 /DNA_START=99 /DNA_END=1718 /DNA_ORIENTATION=+
MTFLALPPTTRTQEAEDLISSCKSIDSPFYVSPKDCKVLSPLNPSMVGKFICIGMNYVDHCTEQNFPIPEEPIIFSKFPSSIVGPNDPIPKDVTTEKLDYEVELGVVIGKTVPRFTEAGVDTLDYVGGYTIIHDVSARDWQLERNGGQWLLGKAVDAYAPMGPYLVTPSSLPDPHNLPIRCRVSGETLQDSSTNQLIFKVDQLISYLSKFMTLLPGDVIATGTPPGVGCFRSPPRWLAPGDVVECEIEGIGTLTNPVVEPLFKPGFPGTPSNLVAVAETSNVSKKGKVDGQNCIVTGAARGLGYGIAHHLGTEGASLVVLIDFDHVEIDAAVESLSKLVPTCKYVGRVCNVTDSEKVEAIWKEVVGISGNGRLDILVQAAGIVGKTNLKCEDVEVENFEDVMKVNVQGIFHGCKAALPYMSKQSYGRIVNIASIAGKEGNAGMLAYSTSKAAVIGLTKTIGKEYATLGITCNAIAPAVVKTEMVANMPDEQVKYMTDKIPMKRCGKVEEIAAMVVFMCSKEAGFTTGFCFDATGGRAVY